MWSEYAAYLVFVPGTLFVAVVIVGLMLRGLVSVLRDMWQVML